MKNNGSTVWLITDTHFGHAQMVEYCGRPENHSELILHNLKNALKPGDTLIHLGDFCIGNDEKWLALFVEALPGVHKILVRGNHDHKSDNWYVQHGFDFVCQAFRNKYFGKNLLFTHIPQENTFKTIDHNVHGHFHNTLHRLLRKEWVTPTEEERNKHDFPLEQYDPAFHKLLAIENTNYMPVTLLKFLEQTV